MQRFILTGAPGSGKTSVLCCLKNMGYLVVEEAATDIIAMEQKKGVQEPWAYPSFCEMILDLQRERQMQAISVPSEIQFFDRAPLDTYALCLYLNFPISPQLLENVSNAQDAGSYEKDVFFIENLGFCEPSEARKISFEEALRFEKIHEDVYTEWGYHCLRIPPQPVRERALTLLAYLKTPCV